jgi:NAD-dependent deacetylase
MDSWHATFLGLRHLPREVTAFEVEVFFQFSAEEARIIEERRGPELKLGLALQIGFLRMSGRLLDAVRIVPPLLWDKQTGLWERFDPMELATPAAYEHDPSLVWGWYEWRRAAVLRAQPNAAHRAIAAMATAVPRLTPITQNVDDLHERAGSLSVLHLHGQLARPYCAACRQLYVFPEGVPPLAPEGQRMNPPRCNACGGRIRPGVVWFGEELPRHEWRAAVDAAGQCDAFFCVGTSSLVQPAASLTDMAIRAGAITIQVNVSPTEMDGQVTQTLRGAAGSVLPRLVSEVWGREIP